MTNRQPGTRSTDPSGHIDEDRLRRIEFDRFLDAVTDYAVYLLDPDGYVMSWNEGATRLKGYHADEIVGEHYSRLFPEAEREREMPERNLRTAAETGRSEYEGWIVLEDGSRKWCRVVTTSILDDDGTLLGFAEVTHDLTEQRNRERELREARAFTQSIFDAQPDVLYTFDRSGNPIEWNDQVAQTTGYSHEELAEMHIFDFIPEEDWATIADAVRLVVEDGSTEVREAALVTKAGDRIPHEFTGAPISEDGQIVGFTGIGRDISERKERERELERQHAELQRLNDLHATTRAINQVLVGAETRDEIEAALVEQFAAAEPYAFTVVGDFDPVFEQFTARAWSGIDDVPRDGILASNGGGAIGTELVATALETQTVQVLQDLPSRPDGDPWGMDARDRGYESVALVPVGANERQYGALCIYSRHEVTDREQGLLEEFGRTVGHAINTLETRRLLYAETVLELEFRSTDAKNFFSELSRTADCRVSLEHVVPVTDDVYLYYVTIIGASRAAVEQYSQSNPAVQETRLIRDDDEESVWEFTVRGSTLTELLANYGARTRVAVAADGETRLVAEVVVDTDVRTLVAAVTAAFPATEFVAKRKVERPSETRAGFRRRAIDDLTEKQRLALEAAYYAGYYDWPSRGSTAEELAATLGISRPTLQQHIRVAEQKLLTAFFAREP